MAGPSGGRQSSHVNRVKMSNHVNSLSLSTHDIVEASTEGAFLGFHYNGVIGLVTGSPEKDIVWDFEESKTHWIRYEDGFWPCNG